MPDRSNFFSVRLAAEATAVASKIAAYLATFIHLMLSFDGWSSKGMTKFIQCISLLHYGILSLLKG